MTKKAAAIGGRRRRRGGSGAQMNNRSWTRKEAEGEEEGEEANNDHLFGDKMRFIVERFRSRALRDVPFLNVRFRERERERERVVFECELLFHDDEWFRVESGTSGLPIKDQGEARASAHAGSFGRRRGEEEGEERRRRRRQGKQLRAWRSTFLA